MNLATPNKIDNAVGIDTASCGPYILEDQIADTPHNVNSLELDNYGNGFKVIRAMRYHVGMGVGAAITHTACSSFGLSAGVAAVKSGQTVFTRFVEGIGDIKNIRKKIPFEVEEFDHWKLGESVSYLTEGGVVFMAGAGFRPVIGVGTKYMITGGWKYSIKKTGCDTVTLKVMKVKAKTGAAYTGTTFVSLSSAKMKSMANGFKFRVYLKDPAAAIAYEEALKGNMEPLQEMANDPLHSSVQKIENVEVNMEGKRKKLSVGIPFLYFKKQTSRYLQYQDVDYLEQDKKKISNYGIFVKDKKARTVTKHKNQQVLFYGGVADLKDNYDESLSRDYNGFFTFSYENDWGESWKFKKGLEKLMATTGMEEYLYASIPKKEKLGYIEILTKVKFPKQYMDFLMKKASQGDGALAGFHKKALLELNDYLSDGKDPYRICPANIGKDRLSRAGLRTCKKKFVKEIAKSIAKIQGSLIKMKETLSVNQKAFSGQVARLGENIVKNRFLFKSFFNEGKQCGLDLEHKIFGKRVSYFRKTFKFDVKASCQ